MFDGTLNPSCLIVDGTMNQEKTCMHAWQGGSTPTQQFLQDMITSMTTSPGHLNNVSPRQADSTCMERLYPTSPLGDGGLKRIPRNTPLSKPSPQASAPAPLEVVRANIAFTKQYKIHNERLQNRNPVKARSFFQYVSYSR